MWRVPVLAFAFALPAESLLAVDVVGDPDLLVAVRDAQNATRASLDRGKMTVEVQESAAIGLHSRATISAMWDGERLFARAEYHLEEIAGASNRDHRRLSRPLTVDEVRAIDETMTWIETPKMFCSHVPSQRRANQRFTSGGGGLFPIFEVRPQRIWLTYHRQVNVPWYKCFDLQTYAGIDDFEIRVEQDAENRMVYRSGVRGTDSSTELVVSLNHGNVVEYTCREEPSGNLPRQVNHGTFEWEQLDSGVWVVREMEQSTTYPELAAEPHYRYSLKLLDYDPEPDIPSNRFEFESLNLPNGTHVVEMRGNGPTLKTRSYNIGNVGGPLPQSQLKQLSDELRHDGFASPKDRGK